jgi:hypothetical protein
MMRFVATLVDREGECAAGNLWMLKSKAKLLRDTLPNPARVELKRRQRSHHRRSISDLAP